MPRKFLGTFSNNFAFPGVIIREKRSGVPQIRGVPTSIAAFAGRCLRGPVGVAILIGSFAQYSRIFGGYDPNSYLPESVKAFYDNGGSDLYIVRELGSSAGANAKATLTLGSSGGAATSGSETSNPASFPAALAPGDTFLGKVDGGGTNTLTIQATNASKTGSAATYAAGAGGDTIVIIINGALGGAQQTIDLSTAAASEAGYLAAINAGLIGGSAVDSGGQLKIQTDQKGSGAGGSIVSFGGAGAAKTGLSVGSFTNAGPNNVANVGQTTAAELAALFQSTFTGSTAVGNANNSITWTSGTTGASSSVQLTSGTGVAKIPGLDNAVHSGAASGAIPVMTFTSVGDGSDNNALSVLATKQNNVISSTIPATVPAGTITSVTLTQAIVNKLQVGDQISFFDSGNSNTVRGTIKQIQNQTVIFSATLTVPAGGLTSGTTSITNETFSIAVLYNGAIVQGPLFNLRMSSLSSKNYFVTRLGGVANQSYGRNALDDEFVVTVADLLASSGNLDMRPANVNTSGYGDSLASGSEATTFADADYIGNQAANPPTGLYALDKIRQVRIVAIPGITGTAVAGFVAKTLIQYCENRADCVAITSVPINTSVTNAVAYQQNNIGSSSYGVLYYPYVAIVSPLTGQKCNSPPDGYIAGMWARTDRNQGVAKAPAGEFTGRLVDTVDVERTISDTEWGQLAAVNINPILNVDGVGQCVMGSHTLEFGDFNQIHVRRTFIYLEQSLKVGTRFVIFEPNTGTTRARVKRVTDAFLEREWRRGTLDGDTMSEAFTTICDKSNNPPVIVKANQMVEDVFVNIPGTVENLVINIQQDQRGQSALLAA